MVRQRVPPLNEMTRRVLSAENLVNEITTAIGRFEREKNVYGSSVLFSERNFCFSYEAWRKR